MGKYLSYVDSYLLLLFLDQEIERDFIKKKECIRNASEVRSNSKGTRTMGHALKYIEPFYDILFKYFGELIGITSNILKLIALVGFIVVISYTLYRVYEHSCKVTNKSKCNLFELQNMKNYSRLFIRQQSIISHKEMLNTLEYAADKCYETFYALKCIDIVVHCPQLLNIKSPPNGLTPFHRICFQGKKSLITFMLAKGADPFLTTTTGENALCMAIYYFLDNPTENDFSCLDILVKTGCGFGFKDKWYNILLEMTFNSNHTRLVQWLILHYKHPSYKLLRCSSTPPILRNYKFN
ncbi:hypothetical protein ANTPLA_LOCUS3791 [Anthophora plagiata]